MFIRPIVRCQVRFESIVTFAGVLIQSAKRTLRPDVCWIHIVGF